MAAELAARTSRQVYREAEPRAAFAKFVNPVAHSPDASWWALFANADRPLVSAGASVPESAIVGSMSQDEFVVAIGPGKWVANRFPDPGDMDSLAQLENSPRASIDVGRTGPVNSI